MKKTITAIMIAMIITLFSPVGTYAFSVNETVIGSLTQEFPRPSSGKATLTITHEDKSVVESRIVGIGLVNPNVGKEELSTTVPYSFKATKAGVYTVSLVFNDMRYVSEDFTESFGFDLNPLSKTIVISDKEPVVKNRVDKDGSYPIPFTTKQVKTDKLYVGESKVVQKGVNGLVQKYVNVSNVDGVDHIGKRYEETTIKMIEEIIEVGTKAKPSVGTVNDNQPIKDKEPQPEKTPDKEPNEDKPEENDIDLDKVIESITIKVEDAELELKPKFVSDVYKYTVEVPLGSDELKMDVQHQNLDETNVSIIYDKEIKMDKSFVKSQIEIHQDGLLKESYEIRFIKEGGSVLEKYEIKDTGEFLYLTEELDLNKLDVPMLKKLNLNQVGKGYYKVDSGYLALLTRDPSKDSVANPEWWLIKGTKLDSQVQPVVVKDELHLVPVGKISLSGLDGVSELVDVSPDLSKFLPKVEDFGQSQIYGYKIDGKFVIPVLTNGRPEFMELDAQKEIIQPFVLGEKSTSLLLHPVVLATFALTLVGLAVFGYKYYEKQKKKPPHQKRKLKSFKARKK